MFSKNVYVQRRASLRQKMGQGIALFLGNEESPMNYPGNTYRYRQDSSFLYFFGLSLPHLAGVVDFDSGEDILFGDEVSIEDVIWMGPQPSVKELAFGAGIEKTRPYDELNNYIQTAIRNGQKIHFLPPYRLLNALLLEDLTGISHKMAKVYASPDLIKAVVSLRSVKDSHEIEELEKAFAIGYQMHTLAMKMCKPGIYEREIAGAIEGLALSHGGTVSFPVILSQNGETLHNHHHGNMLQEGRLMLTDAGAETERGYASDFTRTIPVSGKFTQKQKDIYNIVLAANNATIRDAKPGISYQQLHLQAASIIASGLKDLGLMKGNVSDIVESAAHAMFMPHGLGHMMGLDVHDMEDLGENFVGYDKDVKRSELFGTAYLRLGRKLQPGFVLTVEPGIYFIPALIEKWKKEGIHHSFINFDKVAEYIDFGGIRIEDDILITENACRLLGKRIPASVEEIENFMKQ